MLQNKACGGNGGTLANCILVIRFMSSVALVLDNLHQVDQCSRKQPYYKVGGSALGNPLSKNP